MDVLRIYALAAFGSAAMARNSSWVFWRATGSRSSISFLLRAVLPFEQLKAIGYGLAIFPATAFLAAGAAFESVYSTLKQDRSTTQVKAPLYEFQKFSSLMGFDWVSAFDKTHASNE